VAVLYNLFQEKTKTKVSTFSFCCQNFLQVEEEKLSKSSMLEIHKEWRKMMRLSSLKELREDIQWLSQEHVREVLISLPSANFCPNHLSLSLSNKQT
jgi:hypothetical protein